MATRMLARCSRTYAAAAPLDVAMTEMIDAPMARRMSTWSRSVRTGTTINPPPSPRSAPRNPATKATTRTMATKRSGGTAYAAGDEDDDADELRDGERPEEAVVLRAHDLDEEALDAHQHQEGAEDAPALVRLAREGHQDREHDERRRRLVELRRMDFEDLARQAVDLHAEVVQRLARGRRRAFRKGDADPRLRRAAVVVADEEAADAAERVANGERGRGGVGGGEEVDALAPQQEPAAEEAADQTAVPDEARAVEEKVPVAEEDGVVDLRADDAADRRGHDHGGGEVVGEAVAAKLPRQHPPGHDEREEHHQAEGGDLEVAELDEGWVHRGRL